MAETKKSGGLLWFFVVVALAGAGAGGWWYVKRPKSDAPEFRTAAVGRGDVIQVVTANGALNAVKNVAVGSQISGIINDLRVDYNSQVKAGDVIAQIDPSTYEQNVTQAEADLANAQAGEELAALNQKRAVALLAGALISTSEADKATADLHQAQAVVRTREASLQKARLDLARTTIYAPISGIVISRNVDVGQTVAASFSTPTLFQIANDLTKMQIEAMVSEADVGGVEVGQPVNFLVDAFPGRQFKGGVKQVRYAPTTNQNVVTYISVIEVENKDLKLRPGMTANASIITAQRPGVIRVPNAAFRFRPPASAAAKGQTNAPASAGAKPEAGAPSLAGGGGGREGMPSPEEMRKRFESMTPEQREQMRARFAGGRPPGMGGGDSSRGRSDAPATRTVYLLADEAGAGAATKAAPKAVTVKTGVTDGSFTEVLEGLKEGDTVIIGQNLSTAAAPNGPSSNPFGGGGPRPR